MERATILEFIPQFRKINRMSLESTQTRITSFPESLCLRTFCAAIVAVLALATDANAGVILCDDCAAGELAAQGIGTSRSTPRAIDPAFDLDNQFEPFVGLSESFGGGATGGMGFSGVHSSPAALSQLSFLPGVGVPSRLCEERALVLPTSPLFDRLRPPRLEA